MREDRSVVSGDTCFWVGVPIHSTEVFRRECEWEVAGLRPVTWTLV